MPFEAQNALRGEASAFDALAKSATRLKALRSNAPGAGDPASWNKLNDGVAAVLEARTSVETIQTSTQEVSRVGAETAVGTR